MSSSDEEQTKAVEAASPDASSPSHSRKRKTPHDRPSLEIDLDAPEPPSKKALRRLKKQQKAEKKAAKEEKKKAKSEKKDKKEKSEKKDKKDKKKKKEEEGEEESEESDSSSDDETSKPTKDELKAAIEKAKQAKISKKAAEEDSKAKSKRSNYGIWIGNLSFTTTKADLRAFITSRASLSPHNITRIHMPEGARNAAGKPQNKGFAYVDFDKAECVPAVVALSESDFNGRRCLIKDAMSFEGRPDKKEDADGKASSSKPASRKIFVGNLAYDVNKETLEMHFAKCGTVSNIHIATFEDSGKCKGYGWVEFEDIGSAEAAVRGFVKVPEDDSDDEEEQEDSDSSSSSDAEDGEEKKPKKKTKSKKKQVMKKVWVNRLFGRPLRMEFAEDSETRYNKRFGKGAKRRFDGDAVEGAGDGNAITEVGGDAAASSGREKKFKKANYNNSRYSEQTVARLTGGIVASQGKKVSFD